MKTFDQARGSFFDRSLAEPLDVSVPYIAIRKKAWLVIEPKANSVLYHLAYTPASLKCGRAE